MTALVQESRQFAVIRLRRVDGDNAAGFRAAKAHVIGFTADASQRGRVGFQPAAQGVHEICYEETAWKTIDTAVPNG